MTSPLAHARRASLCASVLGCALAIGPAPLAQQFPQLGGNPLTTAANWSEGVECADVDNDGDLDVFVADGGGFSTPGTQYQNKLYMNTNGLGSFADESVARLGVNVSHAKGVFTGDVDSDGWIDAMFANAFNSDPPHLYMNDNGGAGMFLMDSANRGFTAIYSSASGQFGDLDNDGDLDCILNDSGTAYLGAPGDQPHLFINDGTGDFTEVTGPSFNPPVKQAQMDVQLFDFDQDWDLDFFGDCRASNGGQNHYLMLNDGSASFTNSSALIPSTSANAYESDVSDLDGDTDVDIFYVSLSGFAEGHSRSNWAPSGPLTFTNGGSLGGDDDNEIALLDYNLDGDLDAVIGSLSGPAEKIAINNFVPSGSLTFTNNTALIANISDATLDCTVADVTGDGAYDIITVQGESNMAQWRNKIYSNTGAADNLAPIVVRQEPLANAFQGGPWVVRAEVRDQVMDDGKNWVTASADYTVSGAEGANTVPGVYQGGGIYRFEMTDTSGGTGTDLDYTLRFEDWNGNVTTTSNVSVPITPFCGLVKYGELLGGTNILRLNASGAPTLGSTLTFDFFPVNLDPGFLTFALNPFFLPLAGGTLLIDPGTIIFTFSDTSTGTLVDIPFFIPPDPTLEFIDIYFQAFAFDFGFPPDFVTMSNGVAVTICP